MYCAAVPSTRHSLLLHMYQKFTCRNSGPPLMFINTPSELDNKKHIVNLKTFRDMLHICPRIHGQSFDELPFEEEILEFLWFLRHSAQIKTLTDVNINKLFQPWRSFGAVINKCLTRKSSSFDSFRDDILFSTIKVVSRHLNTQQYGAVLPIELTNEEIRNTKAYKEY
nr:hypothetical protein [Tanacetum cinerariifolium]